MSVDAPKPKVRVLKTPKLVKKTAETPEPNDQKLIYTCQYCLVKFTHNSHYYRHLSANHASQMKSDTFQCDQCRVVFSKKSSLDSHCRSQHKVRSGSRCDSCSLKFKSRYCLRRHVKLKQLLREHACPLCQKRCAGAEALRKHYAGRHSGGAVSYACDQCLMQFKVKRSLNCHVDRIHAIKRL